MVNEVLRNALIVLYGEQGYVKKFASRIGRRRDTVHRWIRGTYPVPVMVTQLLTFLIREKKAKDKQNDTSRAS